MVVKLPAFLAWAAVRAAWGLELVLAQPSVASARAEDVSAAATRVVRRAERVFIFMAAEVPL